MNEKSTIDQELVKINSDLLIRIMALFASDDMRNRVFEGQPRIVYGVLTRIIKEIHQLNESGY